jgi:transposase
MKWVASTLKGNREEVLDHFGHRYTNAIDQASKRSARGFRNPAYFKAAICLNPRKPEYPVMESCATH